MEPIVVAVLIGIAVYMAAVALIPKRILAEPSDYTRQMLKSLEMESGAAMPGNPASVLREEVEKSTAVTRIFLTLPGMKRFYPRMIKGGLTAGADQFFLVHLIGFLTLVYLMKGLGLFSIPAALLITAAFGWWYVNRRIAKRNEAFLHSFPEALDMIVRSVRSGYPLNAAVRMVAENMQPPVSTEFRQVANETAYGSTLIDALTRLAYRIDEPDIHFFVVVLTVQQEVGGNLAEVLTNLAGIIRKRKHLRLKVKALTSEGRATAWILSLLPVVEFLAIYWVAPSHLTPLFVTTLGNMILVSAVAIVLLGNFIVRQMVNMKV